MASTPVKTSLVDRFRTGGIGFSAGDASALKSKAAPEQVRKFESLLDTSNAARPAENPAAKPVKRADAPTVAKTDTRPTAPKPSDAPETKSEQADEIEDTSAETVKAEETANLAGSAESIGPVVAVPSAETPPTLAPVPVAEEQTPTDPAPVTMAEAAPVLPVAIASAAPATPPTAASDSVAAPLPGLTTAALPVDADLAQQEPVTLPQVMVEDAVTGDAPDLPAPVPTDLSSEALPTLDPLPTPAPKPATATPAPVVQPTPQTVAAPPTEPAVIETLTVIPPDAVPEPETDTPASTEKTVATVQADAAAPDTDVTPEIIAAQAAPAAAEGQGKAKPATAKPAQDRATPENKTEALSTLPAAEAVTEAEPQQDKGGREQSHGDRARERAQDRIQTGERLAAKLADSQAALIRDEAALTGPVQTFKAVAKAAAAETLLTAAAPQVDTAKPASTTTPTVAAAALNATGATSQTAAATKPAARSNAPVFHTPVVQQVGTRLVETAANGGGRVVMDLRPEHLGRVTIDVDVRDDGRVSATVLVENPEALEQLRRDAGQLEQALRDTGLSPDQNSLNFALREQHQERSGSGRDGRNSGGDARAAEAEAEAEATPAPTQQSVVPGLGVIDIRI